MNYVEFLFRALDAKVGIVVSTNNPDLLRTKLYAARRQAMNPIFEELSILISRTSPSNEIWIVRKTPQEPTDAEEV